MPKRVLPLTAAQVDKAKAKGKQVTLFDGGGLFLLVTPSGGRLWRLKYRFKGKEKTISLGAYPDISLERARELRLENRRRVANGIDPCEIKKAQKLATTSSDSHSFEVVARTFIAEKKKIDEKTKASEWSESHATSTLQRLEKNVFPWIGEKSVVDVTLSDIKSVLHRIEERATESARRVHCAISKILRYCVVSELIERSPLEGLKPSDILKRTPITTHFPALVKPKDFAPFLRASDEVKTTFVVKCAMRLSPLVFLRPGELRHAEWEEIDINSKEWNIPMAKMKLPARQKAERKDDYHCVPLSRQAIEILEELRPLTGRGRYVFPGARSVARPLSEAAITAVLHRMGYKDEMTWHGYRAVARTILNEVLKFDVTHIEHQLAHAVKDPQGRAYNRTSFLPERRIMMQEWADYVDRLKNESAL